MSHNSSRETFLPPPTQASSVYNQLNYQQQQQQQQRPGFQRQASEQNDPLQRQGMTHTH